MVGCHDQKKKVFLNIKIIICILHISICPLLDSQQGAKDGEQGIYFKENLFLLCQEIVISYSMTTNLSMDIWVPFVVHHKWYGFDPKRKKKKKSWSIKKLSRMCQCTKKTIRKTKKKTINFGYFQHPSILFPMSSTFLVLSWVSPITPYHKFCWHCRPPQLMSLVGCPQPFSQAYFYKASIRDEHLRVKSLLWIIATLA
jgi:hypothetical protein